MAVPQDVFIGEDGAAFIGAMLQAQRVCVIAQDRRARYHCLVRGDSISRTADRGALRRVRALLAYYGDVVLSAHPDLREQIARDIVSHLYTAITIALRGGATYTELGRDFDDILGSPFVGVAFKEVRFAPRGYKLCIKHFILRHRLWWLIKWIDKVAI